MNPSVIAQRVFEKWRARLVSFGGLILAAEVPIVILFGLLIYVDPLRDIDPPTQLSTWERVGPILLADALYVWLCVVGMVWCGGGLSTNRWSLIRWPSAVVLPLVHLAIALALILRTGGNHQYMAFGLLPLLATFVIAFALIVRPAKRTTAEAQ